MREKKETKWSNQTLYDHSSKYGHNSNSNSKSKRNQFPSFNLETVLVICYDTYETIINNTKKTTYDHKLTYEQLSTYGSKLTYELQKSLDFSWIHSRRQLHNQLLLLISMLFKTFKLSNPFQVMIDYNLNNNNHNDDYFNDHNNNCDDDDKNNNGASLLVTISQVLKSILINNRGEDSQHSTFENLETNDDIWNLIKDPSKTQLLLQIFTQNPSLQSGLLFSMILKHISTFIGISKMTIYLSSMFHVSCHIHSNNSDDMTTTSHPLEICLHTFISFLSFTSNNDIVYPVLLWFISCITLPPLPLHQQNKVVEVSMTIGDDDNSITTMIVISLMFAVYL